MPVQSQTTLQNIVGARKFALLQNLKNLPGAKTRQLPLEMLQELLDELHDQARPAKTNSRPDPGVRYASIITACNQMLMGDYRKIPPPYEELRRILGRRRFAILQDLNPSEATSWVPPVDVVDHALSCSYVGSGTSASARETIVLAAYERVLADSRPW